MLNQNNLAGDMRLAPDALVPGAEQSSAEPNQMDALDNPIWQALISTHAHFAEASDGARKFPHEVSVLAGFCEPTMASYRSLAALLRPDERVGLFLQRPPDPPSPWTIDRTTPLLQMLCERRIPPSARFKPTVVPLTHADVPEMLALTKLTNPGPFGPRTREMGDYFGIRVEGTLAAMAGERLKLPGYTEISAVCTHPDHLGHGYASVLINTLIDRIFSRGEQPILHVLPENTRAVQVYERLGFAKRALLHLAVLRLNNAA